MPLPHLGDDAMDETIPDLAPLQCRGHLLQEGIAPVDRERLGAAMDEIWSLWAIGLISTPSWAGG